MSKRWKFIASLMALVAIGVGSFFWISLEKEHRLKTYLEVATVEFDRELTIEGSGNLIYAMPKVRSSKIGKAITEVVENEKNGTLATIIYPEKLVNPLIGDKAYCIATERYQEGLLSDKYITTGASHYLYLTEKGQKLTLEDIVTDKQGFREIVREVWKVFKEKETILETLEADDWSNIAFHIEGDALYFWKKGELSLPVGFWQIIKVIDTSLFPAEKVAEYQEFYDSFYNGTGGTVYSSN